jgi:hypothetical protein
LLFFKIQSQDKAVNIPSTIQMTFVLGYLIFYLTFHKSTNKNKVGYRTCHIYYVKDVIVQQMALIPISFLVLQSYESWNLLYYILIITGTLKKSLY